LALRGVGVGADDEVWISSMTFAGGIFPVVYLNAKPVFFDLDPNTWTIDCDLLEEALKTANEENRLPKAIVPTDLYGQSVDLDRLETMCERFGVALVIDSAESLGASYRNKRKAGSGGDVSILSFNGNKIITTSGGGMLVTRNSDIAQKAQFWSTQARDPAPHYEHSELGYNYRLSNVCAAIGLGQMTVLDERVARRREINQKYRDSFKDFGIDFLPEPVGYHSSHWLTAISINQKKCGINREDIRTALLEHEIEARPLWKPMHMQPLFAGSKYVGQGVDEGLFKDGLCLPSSSNMTDTEQAEVIERTLKLLNQAS
jgi:pyridoxal phosphate-dependent aminotransferase EpsN